MELTTTVTQKGQITIPKRFREKYKIKIRSKVRLKEGKGYVRVYPSGPDILDMAPLGRAPKGKDALKAREAMDKGYSRS